MPLCFLLSTYVFFCGVSVYLLALFVPFVFSPFWVLSLRVLIMSEISELAPMYDTTNAMYRAVSILPDVSAYFMILRKRERERERNRVGGSIGSSEQLWPFPAQSQLSTTIPTFSRHDRFNSNSTLRTGVTLAMFDRDCSMFRTFAGHVRF